MGRWREAQEISGYHSGEIVLAWSGAFDDMCIADGAVGFDHKAHYSVSAFRKPQSWFEGVHRIVKTAIVISVWELGHVVNELIQVHRAIRRHIVGWQCFRSCPINATTVIYSS